MKFDMNDEDDEQTQGSLNLNENSGFTQDEIEQLRQQAFEDDFDESDEL